MTFEAWEAAYLPGKALAGGAGGKATRAGSSVGTYCQAVALDIAEGRVQRRDLPASSTPGPAGWGVAPDGVDGNWQRWILAADVAGDSPQVIAAVLRSTGKPVPNYFDPDPGAGLDWTPYTVAQALTAYAEEE